MVQYIVQVLERELCSELRHRFYILLYTLTQLVY